MMRSVTLALVAVNVILFAAGFFTDYFDREFAFVPSLALEKPWTFVTAMFMHAGFVHIFFNMFVLLMFGTLLESRLRWHTFLIFYLAAGVLGNVIQMAMAFSGIFPSPSPAINPADIPGVGASGAVMGVLGVLGVIAPRISIFVPLIPIPVPMYIGVVIFAVFNVAISFLPTNIGTGAHLGGLALGVLFGLWLRHQVKRSESRVRVRYVWE